MLRTTACVSSGYHLQSNVRRSGPTRIWRQLSTVSHVIIRLPGLPTSLGSNMLIILWFPLPRVCRLSWSLWATSLHFFRFRSLMWPFLLFNITSVKPTESGGRHELPSPGRLLETRDSLIDTTLQPPSIRLVRKCGYPPGTFRYRWSQGRWHQGTLDHSRLNRSSTPQWFASSYRHHSIFIPLLTFSCSSQYPPTL